MELVKSQFSVTYEITDGDVKATAAGVLQNGKAYGSSVRVTCTNTYEVENEKTQFVNDVKQVVSFKISCPDDLTAGKVGKYFREQFKNKKSILCLGGLPDNNNVVTLINPVEYFLPDTDTHKKDPNFKKSNS